VYERGGSLNVIRLPAAGGIKRCGATCLGCSNALNAFRFGQGFARKHARRHQLLPHTVRRGYRTNFDSLAERLRAIPPTIARVDLSHSRCCSSVYRLVLVSNRVIDPGNTQAANTIDNR
jgi:hypothetical protein